MVDGGWPVELATSTSLEAYRANLRMFDALMQMIKARGAFGHEPVVIAASGNESKTQVNPDYKIAASLPAAAEGVISVGALQRARDLFEVAPREILPRGERAWSRYHIGKLAGWAAGAQWDEYGLSACGGCGGFVVGGA